MKALNLESQLTTEVSSSKTLNFYTTQNIAPAKDDGIPALDNEEWQSLAHRFMEWSWKNLHSGDYPNVQQYLAERGFTEYHTDIWQLGYNPNKYRWNWGGVPVFAPKGIVIPWMNSKGYIYKLNIRRDNPTNSKYLQIKGGANWLFNEHRIKAESIVVLVEGELDAISVSIGTNFHRVVPVATGSASGARWLRWAALLASAYRVLIAFDDDEAGEAATKWWSQYLPNSRRLLPEMKDCNEMLINHYPFQQWITKGLS